MENISHKLGQLDLDVNNDMSPADQEQADQRERRAKIQGCIQVLVHACYCRDASCGLRGCRKMKRVVQHTKICQRKTNGGCPICKQLIALCCYHAKHCQKTECPVSFCSNIKMKLKVEHIRQRLLRAQILRRRSAKKMPDASPAPGAHGAGGGYNSGM